MSLHNSHIVSVAEQDRKTLKRCLKSKPKEIQYERTLSISLVSDDQER